MAPSSRRGRTVAAARGAMTWRRSAPPAGLITNLVLRCPCKARPQVCRVNAVTSLAQATCRSCHTSLDFKGAPAECASCHRDVHRGELGSDCARCHTPRSFLDRSRLVRAHQETRFPLTGAHVAVDCERCHTPTPQGQMTFVNRATDCVDCHRAEYQATTNPNHQAGGLSTNCVQCHATTLWTQARFNHAATRFPLTGAHRAVSCAPCHRDGADSGKSTLCF